jgi:hypothetical protein
LPFIFWLRLRRRRLPTNLRSQCRIHCVTNAQKTLSLLVSVWKFLMHLPSQLTERPCNRGLGVRTRRIAEFRHQLFLRPSHLPITKRSARCSRKMTTHSWLPIVFGQATLFTPRRLTVSKLFWFVLVWLDEMWVRHQPARSTSGTRAPLPARSHRRPA